MFLWVSVLLICAVNVSAVLTTGYKPAPLQVGKVYEGFKFVQEKQFPEFELTARLFRHQVTGAEVLKIEIDDNNKVFAAMFKTMPEDDSGIAHIIEHSVLCGSKNYPLKKPFEVLSKGSVKTYLNAETSADKTRYPVASTNTKDFYNLMNVYLDAVFFPNMYTDHMTLQQEGWTYDLRAKDGELKYNGVVFNEMKGALSNPFRLLLTHMKKAIYPEIFMKNESGGMPESIVTLTQEAFEKFHKKYYHPSNSYLYLYGDGNTLEELKILQENALKHFTRGERFTTPKQKDIGVMKPYSFEYSIGVNEDDSKKTNFAFVYSIGDIKNTELEAGFLLINSGLFNYDASEYRRAIMDMNICKNISSGYFSNWNQPMFFIIVEGAKQEDKEKVIDAVTKQLQRAATKGLDLEYLTSELMNEEYYIRRGEFGRNPKGYTLLGYVDSYWIHTNDPMRGLDMFGILEKQSKMADNKKLGKLIKKYLLNSTASSFITMIPKKGLSGDAEKQFAENLKKYKTTLSDEQVEKLVKNTQELEVYKNTPDTAEDIARIPMLQLNDLEKEPAVYLATTDTIGANNVLKYHITTNDIAYVQFFYDVRTVPVELVPYLQLSAMLQGDMDTEMYTYGQLGIELQKNGGGAGVGLDHYVYKNNANDIRPYFSLSGNTLVKNLPKLFELERQLMYKTKFDDENRIFEKIKIFKENMKRSFDSRGNDCAESRLRGFLDASGKFEEITNGIEFYQFIADIEANWDTKKLDVVAKMKQALEMVWNKNNVTISVVCAEKDYATVKTHVSAFLDTFPTAVYPKKDFAFTPEKRNEGIKSASKVQYVLMGTNADNLGYRYDGRMLVMKQILDNEYLYEQIRVHGGAYGTWSGFSPSGFISFGSYRDPNLSRTVDVYKKIPRFLSNYTSTEENLTRIKIGLISQFDYPKTNSQKGNTAIFNTLKGYDEEYFKRTRSEIFATTIDDVRGFAPMLQKILDQSLLCVYGNEGMIEKEKSLFTSTIEMK